MERRIDWVMKQSDRATLRLRAKLEGMTAPELEEAEAVLEAEQRRKEKRFEAYAKFFDTQYRKTNRK